MNDFTPMGMLVNMTIGLAVGGLLMVLLAKLWHDPFEIRELDRYQANFGSGPVTVTPETPSEWIAWDCSDELPAGLRLHSMVQVRYVSGRVSDISYAGSFYWGRFARYPASGSHIAAYRIVNN